LLRKYEWKVNDLRPCETLRSRNYRRSNSVLISGFNCIHPLIGVLHCLLEVTIVWDDPSVWAGPGISSETVVWDESIVHGQVIAETIVWDDCDAMTAVWDDSN